MKLTEVGARRAIVLQVGGAFHSPLMEPAKKELQLALENTNFDAPVCPIYQNVDALPVKDPETIKQNLIAQLTAPVLWTQTVKNMLADGIHSFVEGGGNRFSIIRPNASDRVILPEGRDAHEFKLPEAYQAKNVLVEVVGAGQKKAQAYYANALRVNLAEIGN